jgi:hypothetical protein
VGTDGIASRKSDRIQRYDTAKPKYFNKYSVKSAASVASIVEPDWPTE